MTWRIGMRARRLIGIRMQANSTMVPSKVRHQDPSAYPQCLQSVSTEYPYVRFADSTTLRGVTGGGQNSTFRRIKSALPIPPELLELSKTLKGLTSSVLKVDREAVFHPRTHVFAIDYGHSIHAIDVCTCDQFPQHPLRIFP